MAVLAGGSCGVGEQLLRQLGAARAEARDASDQAVEWLVQAAEASPDFAALIAARLHERLYCAGAVAFSAPPPGAMAFSTAPTAPSAAFPAASPAAPTATSLVASPPAPAAPPATPLWRAPRRAERGSASPGGRCASPGGASSPDAQRTLLRLMAAGAPEAAEASETRGAGDSPRRAARAVTTLRLSGLPPAFTRDNLVEELGRRGFEGAFDFLYLPNDFGRKRSGKGGKGYAFVNFIRWEDAASLAKQLAADADDAQTATSHRERRPRRSAQAAATAGEGESSGARPRRTLTASVAWRQGLDESLQGFLEDRRGRTTRDAGNTPLVRRRREGSGGDTYELVPVSRRGCRRAAPPCERIRDRAPAQRGLDPEPVAGR